MDLRERVIALVAEHPAVERIELVGSRAEGRATERSDWDFRVDTDDFPAVASSLPALVAPLAPLVEQWDRLSPHWCYMLLLRGPVKVDLIFPDEPHPLDGPWEPSASTAKAIDAHFWDWMLWLRSKEAAGRDELVASELEKLHVHLLAPLGVERPLSSVAEAVPAYREARGRLERNVGVRVPRDLENAVASAL